ncbi:Rha family transcriptional regulator [Pseudomonas moorei]|uniref:Rha family transcriptional regulator n=1 Tax=Pseudomonas moorei TaxID=395599 RepID=UPI00200DD0AE|nr:Rha family transcriptional regulator [Pseudomonas moorei]
MTSQEIADLVGSQHSHLKISIERLMDRGVIQGVAMRQLRSDSGQLSKVYVFSGPQGKRDSIIVVAQLSPEFTAALVESWQELEVEKGQAPYSIESVTARSKALDVRSCLASFTPAPN